MTGETRTIIIEAPMGERFEADIPCDTLISKLANDFLEAQGWPGEQRGQRQRAVAELVNPRNPDETKRLNGDEAICAAAIENGNTLRIFVETVAGGPEADDPYLNRLLDELTTRFDGRITALEKRLDETAASLTHLTQTLRQQQAQGNNKNIEQSVAALSEAFNALAHSLQRQPIAFRSLPTAVARQALYEVLRSYFSLSELQELCFALAIPFSDLPGDTQTDKVRELIEYAQRHGRWPDLETAVRERRPHLNWEAG